jgi:acyl-[acyl-carrier-protein]-phospholipid O-acyltransferase/long-chain-fatty-acid--[acyl-carrier-protein] ligase
VLAPDEVNVGVLLPPGAAGVVVNAAIAVDRRTSVNLNYTVTSEIMNACIRQAEIKHVLTSRRFMEKMDFDLETNVVYLEDFKDRATIVDKVIAALATFIVPSFILGRCLGCTTSKMMMCLRSFSRPDRPAIQRE